MITDGQLTSRASNVHSIADCGWNIHGHTGIPTSCDIVFLKYADGFTSGKVYCKFVDHEELDEQMC